MRPLASALEERNDVVVATDKPHDLAVRKPDGMYGSACAELRIVRIRLGLERRAGNVDLGMFTSLLGSEMVTRQRRRDGTGMVYDDGDHGGHRPLSPTCADPVVSRRHAQLPARSAVDTAVDPLTSFVHRDD
jgi:hypothetical protein